MRNILGQKMKFFILVIIVIFISSCTTSPGQKEYLELDRVSTSDHNKRQTAFSAYPVEKQIDIYLYAWYGPKGGGMNALFYLINDGESKVPQILKRLDQTTEPNHKAALLNALLEIERNCHCVANNPQIIEILEKSEIKKRFEGDQGFIFIYQTYLQQLKDEIPSS